MVTGIGAGKGVCDNLVFLYHLWLLDLGWRPGRGGIGESTGMGRLGERGVVVDKVNVCRWHSLWSKSTWLFV